MLRVTIFQNMPIEGNSRTVKLVCACMYFWISSPFPFRPSGRAAGWSVGRPLRARGSDRWRTWSFRRWRTCMRCLACPRVPCARSGARNLRSTAGSRSSPRTWCRSRLQTTTHGRVAKWLKNVWRATRNTGTKVELATGNIRISTFCIHLCCWDQFLGSSHLLTRSIYTLTTFR